MSARAKTPTTKGSAPAPTGDEKAGKLQDGFRPMRPSKENLKTEIFDTESFARARSPVVPGERDDGSFRHEVATPIKAISMKAADDAKKLRPGTPEDHDTRPKPRVQLRAMSEVSPNPAAQQNLGRLAPPRDRFAARARRVQDYLLWGSVSVIIASVVALIIWFVAR